jgi:hypothetical protein
MSLCAGLKGGKSFSTIMIAASSWCAFLPCSWKPRPIVSPGPCSITPHFHLLPRYNIAELFTFMRCLPTGYAVNFNHRHKRSGHHFQNRYKSIICEEDGYRLELIRYIHLNPLRAGMAANLETLDLYPWSRPCRPDGQE